jgi:hypothetical protein
MCHALQASEDERQTSVLAGAIAAAMILYSTLPAPCMAGDMPAVPPEEPSLTQNAALRVADSRPESKGLGSVASAPSIKGDKDYQLPPGNDVRSRMPCTHFMQTFVMDGPCCFSLPCSLPIIAAKLLQSGLNDVWRLSIPHSSLMEGDCSVDGTCSLVSSVF